MAHSCCNPFGLTNHNWTTRKMNLRSVTSWMCERAPISMGSKICDNCRKKLATVDIHVEVDSPEDHEASEVYVDPSEAISSLNHCLAEIGETPYSKHKAHQCHYPKEKIKKITETINRVLLHDTDYNDSLRDENELNN